MTKAKCPLDRALWTLLLLVWTAGCGGDKAKAQATAAPATAAPEGEEGEASPAPEESATSRWSSLPRTAAIKGVVRFEGRPPPRKPVDTSREAYCSAKRPAPLLDESVVVNPDGTLKNVFVWIKKGVKGRFPAPEEPVRIDQILCQYKPHVLGLQVGQKLVVRNDDPLLHNIHGLSRKHQDFNYGQASRGMENTFAFRRAEVMMPVKCEVHDWMHAYVGVVPHPFFAVTGERGTFALGKLPKGRYTVEAWQERYGKQSLEVTLKGSETKKIAFTYRAP